MTKKEKCKTVSELISLNLEQKVVFRQQCEINIHLLFCPYCRAFKKNTRQIRQLMKQFQHRQEE